jgi:indolepyruvate ferredoxin oxidoreductase
LQREFREIRGTSIILYDQTCATEKRRRRKRGTLVDPAVRVLINETVCEGCGDCGVQSNCLAVEPLETEFGRKRQINQSSCNKDMSCLKGFCPSFVTVEGGTLKKKAQTPAPAVDGMDEVPEPDIPQLAPGAAGVWGIVVAGVGGTGVITIGQLLGMAAHLEGKGIVTQDAAGLAQKGGATWSHVLIAERQESVHVTRVGMAAADLVIACDPIVAAGKETLLRMRPGRTRVALNSHGAPTAAFVRDADWQNPAAACASEVARAVSEAGVGDHAGDMKTRLGVFDADSAALRLMGDSLYANPMMLGYAWQRGWVPLRLESLLRAIELNGVAVAQNKTAFDWGRRAAHAPEDFARRLAPTGPEAHTLVFHKPPTLDQLVARRVEFLTAYQDAAYAGMFRVFVERVRQAESAFGKTQLSDAVARGLFKLMAYKDEYEVARLHSDPAFLARIAAQFEGDFKLHYHLAPPLLARRNARGELQKRKFGPFTLTVFKGLARLKGLRGTAVDPFGHTEERKTERALVGEYRACIEELLAGLSAQNLAAATEIARLPEQIRGYGHVKARHLAAVRGAWATKMAAWRVQDQAPGALPKG